MAAFPIQAAQGQNPGAPIPGIPPNMSTLAAMSAGLMPANVIATNLGATSRGGRSVLESFNTGDGVGTGSNIVALGGSPNCAPCGGNSFGAGGYNQTNGPGAGEQNILPTSSPATAATIPAQPVYQG